MKITQGSRDVVEYALEFRTIAAQSRWNEPALKTAFHQGLNLELVCQGGQLTLNDLIDLAIRLDRLRRTNCPALWGPVPMQLSRIRIREEERERRRRESCCFYCSDSLLVEHLALETVHMK